MRELGLDSDGTRVLGADGTPVVDPYLGVEVTLERMVLMPGSTIVIDDNAASIAAYLSQHPEANAD